MVSPSEAAWEPEFEVIGEGGGTLALLLRWGRQLSLGLC